MRTSIAQLSLLALLTSACTFSAQAQANRATTAAKPATKAPVAAATSAKPATPAKAAPVTPAATATSAKPATAAPAAQPTAQPAPAQRSEAPALARRTSTAPAASRSTSARPTATLPAKHKYLNAGIGVAAYYGGGLPLGISFEVDAKNNISVGGSVDFFRYGYNSGGYRWNYTFVYAGARASYHLADLLNVQNKKFDPYAGATLGFRYAGYSDNTGYNDYVSPYSSGLFLGVHLGSRYMFSEKLGGFAEVGYGVSALRLGVAAKF